MLLVSFPQGASSTQERLSRRKKAQELKNAQCNRKRSLRFCAILNLLQQQESWFSSLFAERGVCDQTKVALCIAVKYYNIYISIKTLFSYIWTLRYARYRAMQIDLRKYIWDNPPGSHCMFFFNLNDIRPLKPRINCLF